MIRSSSLFVRPSVFLAALLISACGSNRQLESVTLNPASADAKNYPNGQVPFIATGTFSKPPSPVQLTTSDVMWCFGDANGGCAGYVAPYVSVDQNGIAQCSTTYVGTATILAGTPSKVMVMADAGPQLKVFGSATLTCP